MTCSANLLLLLDFLLLRVIFRRNNTNKIFRHPLLYPLPIASNVGYNSHIWIKFIWLDVLGYEGCTGFDLSSSDSQSNKLATVKGNDKNDIQC